MQRIFRRTWISIICQQMLRRCYESASRYLILWHSNSISPRLRLLPNGIHKYAGLDLGSRDSWKVPRIPRCTSKSLNYSFFHCFDFEMRTWPQASGAPQIHNWQMIQSPLLHHVQYSTYAIYREIGQPGTCNVAYQLPSSHICHY